MENATLESHWAVPIYPNDDFFARKRQQRQFALSLFFRLFTLLKFVSIPLFFALVPMELSYLEARCIVAVLLVEMVLVGTALTLDPIVLWIGYIVSLTACIVVYYVAIILAFLLQHIGNPYGFIANSPLAGFFDYLSYVILKNTKATKMLIASQGYACVLMLLAAFLVYYIQYKFIKTIMIGMGLKKSNKARNTAKAPVFV